MSNPITPHSARVQEIIKHMRAKRARDAQDSAWKRLAEKGGGRVKGAYIPPERYSRDIVPPVFLREGMWTGRRCFIIGGGPSLRGFDFTRLTGELVIAINRAFEYVDHDIMFSIDTGVYDNIRRGRFGDPAREKFERFRGLKIWLDEKVPDVFHLRNAGITGLSNSLKDGLCTGGNSGYAALNLAILLGANPIYLLGFDMRGNGQGTQAWFHDGYPTKQAEKVYDEFLGHFNAVAGEVSRRGVSVINLNPESRMTCFPFGRFEEVGNLGGEAILFDGCLGFGDNFEQRPLVRHLAKKYKTVYVRTALPEAYWDIPGLKFVYPQGIKLRTQRKHLERLPAETWSPEPAGIEKVGWRQGFPRQIPGQKNINIAWHLKEKYAIPDYDFMFPVRTAWVEAARQVLDGLPVNGKKVCIIRQPTDRKEWPNRARNPKTEYYQLLIDRYGSEYFFINIADLKQDEEWFEKPLRGIDAEFIGGQLPLTTIFGLLKIADMVITFPGFLMPAAIAIRAKTFILFGGEAGPEMHVDPVMGTENVGWVAPDPFCRCFNTDHDCPKDIPEEKVIEAFEELRNRPRKTKAITVGTPPGLGDTLWIMTKMESFRERHGVDKLRIAVCNGGLHKYTTQFLELLPFVDEVEAREKHFDLTPMYDKKFPLAILPGYQGTDYFIDPGGQMWLGDVRLEDVLPEYETHWRLPIRYPEESRRFAVNLKDENGGRLVLFYPSAIGNNNNWNGGSWPDSSWLRLAQLINEHSGARPFLIGAPFDKDHSLALKRGDSGNVLQDITGETNLPQALALIREANLIVSFPSGLPMLATYLGTPTVILWPVEKISPCGRFRPAFQWTWVPPDVRESGRYIPAPFGGPETTPEKIFERVKEFLG